MDKPRYERPMIRKLETGMPNKFGTRNEILPLIHLDGIAVKSLLQDYGSPLFVISERILRDTFDRASRAFTTRYPKVQFAWSYKTNYLDAVCRIYHQMGSWAEVVSGFEYDKALHNGVPGNKVIFNGPDKTLEDLRKAITNDSLIHIDHLDELYSIIGLAGEMNRRPRVAVRVNMDTGVYPMWDRFGFNYENGQAWDAINKIMHSEKLELAGLHTHIGTFMLTSQAYATAAGRLSELAIAIRKKFNHSIKYIDLGGGFASKNTLKGAYFPGTDASPGFDDYAEAITTVLVNAGFEPGNMPLLILETGRALIDDAGFLLGTVVANKRLSDGRRNTIVDVGVNILFTSFWYDHRVSPAQESTTYVEDTVLYGPLCMNIDVIRENVSLPLLNKGDHFVIHSVGAYNMTQWMQFITLRPEVVLIGTDDKVHTIRKHESLNNITALEEIPEHLKKFKL